MAKARRSAVSEGKPAFLFDLDGTLIDSVYQHVLAWREALHEMDIELSTWRIHRRVGMSDGDRPAGELNYLERRAFG